MSVSIYLVPDASLQPADLSDLAIAEAAVGLQEWIDEPSVGPASHWSQGQYQVRSVVRGVAAPQATDHQWVVLLMAHSDVGPGVGGYHYSQGNGIAAKIFVVDCNAGYPGWWTVALTHEVVEMMADRWTNSLVLGTYQGNPAAFQVEAGDPCEQYSQAFMYGQGKTMLVTEYCYPAYFRQGAPGPYSSMGHINAPLTPVQGCRQEVLMISGGITLGATTTNSAAGGHAISQLPDRF